MPTYEFKYRLQDGPTATEDGSGQVNHGLVMCYRAISDSTAWLNCPVVPGHVTVCRVPAAKLQEVLDMPHTSGVKKDAKNAAYKALLRKYRGNQRRRGTTGWSEEGAQAYLQANDASAKQAQRADDYIRVTLKKTPPIVL